MPSITTLCDICGKLAARTCKMCGRRVCDSHYEQRSGMCTSCAPGRKIR